MVERVAQEHINGYWKASDDAMIYIDGPQLEASRLQNWLLSASAKKKELLQYM